MPKTPITAPGWKYLGGSKREYVNLETGELLPRRQYDKRFGSLAKGGFTSYEQKAKANRKLNSLLAQARPARGRPSTVKETKIRLEAEKKLTHAKGLRPLTKNKHLRKSRQITIPFINETQFRADYEATVSGINKNPKIFGSTIDITYIADFKDGRHEPRDRNLQPLRARGQIVGYAEFQELFAEMVMLYENSYDIDLESVTFHIVFTSVTLRKLETKRNAK